MIRNITLKSDLYVISVQNNADKTGLMHDVVPQPTFLVKTAVLLCTTNTHQPEEKDLDI